MKLIHIDELVLGIRLIVLLACRLYCSSNIKWKETHYLTQIFWGNVVQTLIVKDLVKRLNLHELHLSVLVQLHKLRHFELKKSLIVDICKCRLVSVFASGKWYSGGRY